MSALALALATTVCASTLTPVARRGEWRAERGELTPVAARVGDHALARVPGPGTLHVRFTAAAGAPLALAFNAAVDAGGALRGHALRLNGRFAQLVTLGPAGHERITDAVFIPRRAYRARLAVDVLRLDGIVVACVRDAGGGELLAVLSAQGLAPYGDLAGPVVLDVAEGVPAAGVGDWQVRPACTDVPAGADLGPPILVTVPSDDAPIAAGAAIELEPAAFGAGVHLRVGLTGLERLYCAGRQLERVVTDMPWKYRDLVYFLSARAAREGTVDVAAAAAGTYKDPAMVEAVLRAVAARCGRRCRLATLGYSHGARPLLHLAVDAAPGDAPSLLLTGGTHGDEQLSTEIVLDAAARLVEDLERDGPLAALARGVAVHLVPLVNPDGLAAYLELGERAGRKNGRDHDGDGARGPTEGVDLYHNFPAAWATPCAACDAPGARLYRGPAPASEPETQALIRLAEREHFAAAVLYHVGDVAVLTPYGPPSLARPVPDETWLVAEELVQALPPHPEGRPWSVRRAPADAQGTDLDWLRFRFGTAAFLVESCAWPSPLAPGARGAALAALRPTWTALLARLAQGPRLTVFAADERGAPLVATVRVRELPTRAGEQWRTRPRDGRFDRLLPRSGSFWIELVAPGRKPWSGVVRVESGAAVLRATLAPG